MSNLLQQSFSEVLTRTETILNGIKPFDHPLLSIVRTSLQEQKDNLEKLLDEIRDEKDAELEEVREHISIIYHDHEISAPMFESWVRASEWMELPSKDTANEVSPLFPEIKKHLEKAASELEKIYGKEEIKFVVPSFFIPTLK